MRRSKHLPGDDGVVWAVDLELRLEHPALRAIREYWESKRSGGALPSRVHLEPVEMKGFLQHVLLVDVQQSPRRYRWRLVGTAITEALGRDNTGRWFDEIYDADSLASMVGGYDMIVASRRPVRVVGRAAFAGKPHTRFEAVSLPLAAADGAIDMVLVGAVYGV